MQNCKITGQGFRFGMLLQLAVGPVCLFVLHSSVNFGFWAALGAVLAVVFVDALFIAVSSVGVTAALGVPAVRHKAPLFGGIILCVFGLQMLLGAFNIQVLPAIRLFSASADTGLFVQALLMTLSNPLIILFWGGALTAKVAENRWSRKQLFCFAVGCVLATAFFLTAVAALGGLLQGKLPQTAIIALNIAVALLMLAFGIRLMIPRD